MDCKYLMVIDKSWLNLDLISMGLLMLYMDLVVLKALYLGFMVISFPITIYWLFIELYFQIALYFFLFIHFIWQLYQDVH